MAASIRGKEMGQKVRYQNHTVIKISQLHGYHIVKSSASASRIGHYGAIQMLYYYYKCTAAAGVGLHVGTTACVSGYRFCPTAFPRSAN